jgi:hypothetical protein
MLAMESSPAVTRFGAECPQPSASRERRRSGRVQSKGTAIVYGSCTTHGRITDLAIGGLSLQLDTLAVPDVGDHVRVDVRLDGLGRWLYLTGSVLRVDLQRSGAAIVLELLVVPQDFEDLVQDELLFALEGAQLPQILLVDGARGRRERVAAAFRATGCHVIEVSSPLEAIAEIDQSRLHLWAVVIADTQPASRANELRRWLGELYPEVPLLDMGQRVPARVTPMITVDGFPTVALQMGNLVGTHEQFVG